VNKSRPKKAEKKQIACKERGGHNASLKFSVAAITRGKTKGRPDFRTAFNGLITTLFRGGLLFRLGAFLFALVIIHPAFAFDGFVILSSHNSLLCSRDAVL